jgi:outer membrane lipoprotein-sorting protein
MKKIYSFIISMFLVMGTSVFAQNITTASAYFKSVSEYYGTLKDYEVDFEIKMDKQETAGVLSFKAPDLLRMDYTNPKEQVIVFNGELLTVYLPNSDAILQQQVQDNGSAVSLSTPMLVKNFVRIV